MVDAENPTAQQTIRVVLVDDHPIFLQGLLEFLEHEPDIVCVGTAHTEEEALELIPQVRPDVAVLDVCLPSASGPALARRLRELMPGLIILALSGFNTEDLVIQMIRAGASGYLLKTATGAEIAEAIRRAVRGEAPLTPAVASRVLQQIRHLSQVQAQAAARADGLTERELEILQLVAHGKSNREIAQALFLSERTVENHLQNIYRKLNVHDRTQATLIAMRKGYVRLYE